MPPPPMFYTKQVFYSWTNRNICVIRHLEATHKNKKSPTFRVFFLFAKKCCCADIELEVEDGEKRKVNMIKMRKGNGSLSDNLWAIFASAKRVNSYSKKKTTGITPLGLEKSVSLTFHFVWVTLSRRYMIIEADEMEMDQSEVRYSSDDISATIQPINTRVYCTWFWKYRIYSH